MVNLSRVELSQEELKILSKGLKFAPQPPKVNRFELKQDLEAFGRRMRLREFFFDPEASEDEEYNPEERRFKEKSTWKPPKNRDTLLEAYLNPTSRMRARGNELNVKLTSASESHNQCERGAGRRSKCTNGDVGRAVRLRNHKLEHARFSNNNVRTPRYQLFWRTYGPDYKTTPISRQSQKGKTIFKAKL